MCGIVGIYAYSQDGPPVDRAELLTIRESMQRRGPDGEGLWIAPHGRVGLAHRRLAIIDPSEAGAQPMCSADGRLWITFNGEIYNFRTLRQELERRGHGFRSNCDTEILLRLYLEHGPHMVRHLRGMFAFGIWDERDRSLFLARDPFGIKPLYYSNASGTLRFASQVKALLSGGAIDPSPDAAGHVGFFLWGCVPEPFTTYQAVRALPAGSTMLVSPSGPQTPSAYFSVHDEMLRAESNSRPLPASEAQALIREALRDSVRAHFVSDVPVGLFLSAGIDSSALLAASSELLADRLRTVTLGFREYQGTDQDETVWAARTAAAYGARHETRFINKRDFEEQTDAILSAMDQPSIDGVNTWLVSRAAAQTGLKVALSGLGGDELFGGYPSFRDVPRMEALPALGHRFPRTARTLRRFAASLTGRWISPKYAGIFELGGRTGGAYLLRRGLYMPWELDAVMDADMAARGLDSLNALPTVEDSVRGLRSPRLRVAALELCWYMRNQLLRDSDWAGMAHSLEIRVPLIDIEFFRAVLPTLSSSEPPNKGVLAHALSKPLPREIIQRAKSGFAVPAANWITGSAAGQARGLRGWARRVNIAPGIGFRVLALVSDSYGGVGGIAKFNQNLFSALSSHDAIREIVVIPRSIKKPLETLPRKLQHITEASAGKIAFLSSLIRLISRGPRFDLVLCGHLNLAPAAKIAALACGARSVAMLHGIEAWKAARDPLTAASARSMDFYLTVSNTTRERFVSWAGVRPEQIAYLRNAVVLENFGPGPKDPQLVDRYELEGRRVLMTVGRLTAEERYKGFDEVIGVLPTLLTRHPDLIYLIVGDGSDRARLEELVDIRGLRQHVRFTGYISEEEKSAHYRLADVYVMPSMGEGFGIVFLEALASGLPVVASKLDGGREALMDGELGILVDPRSSEDIVRGVEQALRRPVGPVSDLLQRFSFKAYEQRCHALLSQLIYGRQEINQIETVDACEIKAN
jgi:asparagine synthase (glutamine-hydrolysing)